MLSQTRVLDWLSLLNYEVLHQARFHGLSWQHKGNKFLCTHLPALGCMSVIVARKRTLRLTPKLMKMGVRKPSLRRAVDAVKSYRKIPADSRHPPELDCQPHHALIRRSVRYPHDQRGP